MQNSANWITWQEKNNDHEFTLNSSKLGEVLATAVAELRQKTPIDPESLNQFVQLRDVMLAWCETELANHNKQCTAESWSGWDWRPYVDDAGNRLGLLQLYKNNPTPIHDHPGAGGILLVLQGELELCEYQLEQTDAAGRLKLAQLSVAVHKHLGPGQFTLITPESGNLHSLGAASDTCIVLSVLLKTYDETQRTWYLPVTETISPETPFTAFCATQQVSRN